jgi:MFS transporter, ACS family, allantoate permease
MASATDGMQSVPAEKLDPEKQVAYDHGDFNSDVGKVKLKHADRNDADEALKVFADGEVIILTPTDEKRLLRKIDLNLIPLMCIIYGLNYLDKTTLSYSSIMGLKVRCCTRYLTPSGDPIR